MYVWFVGMKGRGCWWFTEVGGGYRCRCIGIMQGLWVRFNRGFWWAFGGGFGCSYFVLSYAQEYIKIYLTYV